MTTDNLKNNEEKRYIIHHTDSDGACAAMVTRLHWDWKDAELYPTTYVTKGEEKWPKEIPLEKNVHVVIVDFSYPRRIITDANSKLGSLLVLDHHHPAKEELAGLPYVRYSETLAGAGMAWAEFFPGLHQPPVVKYTDDYDLWNKQYPQSEWLERAARIQGRAVDVEYWHQLHTDDRFMYDQLEFGRKMSEGVAKICDNIHKKGHYAKIDLSRTSSPWRHMSATVALINVTEYLNDIPEWLYTMDTDCEFVITYRVLQNGGVKFSFRSPKIPLTPNRTGVWDMSQVAQCIGGNGRSTTAGAVCPMTVGFGLLQQLYMGVRND